MNFIKMINKSEKEAPKLLLQHVKDDVRSVTGSNIRQILLENEKTDLADITFNGEVLHQVPEGEKWRIGFALDSIDILNDVRFALDIDKQTVKHMLNDICTA